jgi:hypothetical protein
MAQNPPMIFMYLLLRDEGSKAHSKGVEGSKAHLKGGRVRNIDSHVVLPTSCKCFSAKFSS